MENEALQSSHALSWAAPFWQHNYQNGRATYSCPLNKMVPIDFICEAPASIKPNFDATNILTDELNNFIGEMF